MADELRAGPRPASAPSHGEQIGRADLRTIEASGLSLAGLAPTMAMALGTAFAASEAGRQCRFRTCSPWLGRSPLRM